MAKVSTTLPCTYGQVFAKDGDPCNGVCEIEIRSSEMEGHVMYACGPCAARWLSGAVIGVAAGVIASIEVVRLTERKETING
jgi:hypothetical protein